MEAEINPFEMVSNGLFKENEIESEQNEKVKILKEKLKNLMRVVDRCGGIYFSEYEMIYKAAHELKNEIEHIDD